MNGFVHRNIVFSYYYILCTVYDHLNKSSSQLTLKVGFFLESKDNKVQVVGFLRDLQAVFTVNTQSAA